MINPYDFIDFTGNKNYAGLTPLQCWEKIPEDLKWMITAEFLGKKIDAFTKVMEKVITVLDNTAIESPDKSEECLPETEGGEVVDSSPSDTPV